MISRWMMVYAFLLSLSVFVCMYGRSLRVFLISCICFGGGLLVVKPKYHWGIYALFVLVIIKYYIIIPSILAVIGYLFFDAKVRVWVKLCIVSFLIFLLILFYHVPAGKRMVLTQNLNNGDIFTICVHHPQSVREFHIIMEEQIDSGHEYYLQVYDEGDEKSLGITVVPDNMKNNHISFFDVSESPTRKYAMKISSNSDIPKKTSVILQCTVPWGKAILNGFEMMDAAK